MKNTLTPFGYQQNPIEEVNVLSNLTEEQKLALHNLGNEKLFGNESGRVKINYAKKLEEESREENSPEKSVNEAEMPALLPMPMEGGYRKSYRKRSNRKRSNRKRSNRKRSNRRRSNRR